MPRFFVQHKDPDFYVRSESGEEELHNLSEADQNALYELGIKEYLALVVDTDAGTVQLLKRGEKFAQTASH